MSANHVFTHDGRTVSVVLPASPGGYTLTYEATDGNVWPLDWANVTTHTVHYVHAVDAASLLGTNVTNIRNVTCSPAPLDIPRGTPLKDVPR